MKVRIALFFSIIFTCLIIAPTVMVLADDTENITILFQLNEEENKGKNKLDEVQKIYQPIINKEFLASSISIKPSDQLSDIYKYLYLDFTTPPPEVI